MQKPVIATTLSGLFIKSEPWKNAHLIWYDEREKELKEKGEDTSVVKEWRRLLSENPDEEKRRYFKFVDRVMKQLYPNLTDEKRTRKSRELFFDATIEYILQNKDVVNKNIVEYFRTLKTKYTLALITTNTSSALERILKISDLEDLFDLTETSKPEEKDIKEIVFDRFIKKYGKPLVYIGGSKKDSFDYCNENKLRCIFANLENQEEIGRVESVHDLGELKKIIRNI